eukprot:m.10476 g.10476  ORF g.10476 m.10476 type:complete len:187 (+) comp4268_c0_seq1:275-835(+)
MEVVNDGALLPVGNGGRFGSPNGKSKLNLSSPLHKGLDWLDLESLASPRKTRNYSTKDKLEAWKLLRMSRHCNSRGVRRMFIGKITSPKRKQQKQSFAPDRARWARQNNFMRRRGITGDTENWKENLALETLARLDDIPQPMAEERVINGPRTIKRSNSLPELASEEKEDQEAAIMRPAARNSSWE